MEKFFASLRELNPGYEVADVRFLADQVKDSTASLEDIDAELSHAVRTATDMVWASVS